MTRGRWTTTEALAAYFNVSRRTITNWVASGRIKAHRAPLHYSDTRPRKTTTPGRWRIHEDDLSAFLLAFRGDGRVPPGLLRDR